MTLITPSPPVEIDNDTWRFEWPDNGGPYHVYYRGRRIALTSAATIDIIEFGTLVPAIEIATSADDVPLQVKHPGRVALQWRHPEGGPDVVYYRIESLTGGSWVLEDVVAPSPRRYHRWSSEVLADDTTHERRIVPVMAGEHQLDPVAFAVLVVRMPDLPIVDYVYSPQTGDITVTVQ